jgi:hypothetical protein
VVFIKRPAFQVSLISCDTPSSSSFIVSIVLTVIVLELEYSVAFTWCYNFLDYHLVSFPVVHSQYFKHPQTRYTVRYSESNLKI